MTDRSVLTYVLVGLILLLIGLALRSVHWLGWFAVADIWNPWTDLVPPAALEWMSVASQVVCFAAALFLFLGRPRLGRMQNLDLLLIVMLFTFLLEILGYAFMITFRDTTYPYEPPAIARSGRYMSYVYPAVGWLTLLVLLGGHLRRLGPMGFAWVTLIVFPFIVFVAIHSIDPHFVWRRLPSDQWGTRLSFRIDRAAFFWPVAIMAAMTVVLLVRIIWLIHRNRRIGSVEGRGATIC